jgi:hypothetical protein
MRVSTNKLLLTAISAVAALGFCIGAANARPYGGWGGGFGPGFVGGVVVGAATVPYWRGYHGYDDYAYEPYAYVDYGPDCYIRRSVTITGWGERIIRRVQVCY